jgi:hypothetical protein
VIWLRTPTSESAIPIQSRNDFSYAAGPVPDRRRPTADKPTVSFAPPADPDRVSAENIFRVDDCRGTYELLRSRGAAFVADPVDWGGKIRAFFR